MVSHSENLALGTVSTVTEDRGMRDPALGSSLLHGPSLVGRYHSFWGSVVAGAVIAISLSVMSYALMFGCHVGLYNPQGDINWGVGAVIWSAITAAITFYIGGLVASLLMPLDRHGWIHGLAVWALSVPLVLILTSLVAIGTSMAYGGMTPSATGHIRLGFVPTIVQLSPGVGWMLFISLFSGLIFAIFGGLSGGNRDLVTSYASR